MTDLLHADRLSVRAIGKPIAQGSKRIGRHSGRPVILDSNDKLLTPWRDHVTGAARDQARYTEPFTGPVRAWIRFTFDRPPSHYGTGRNAHVLKATAPASPGHGCGDLDKLVRAILDALTAAGVYADDTQVVDIRARKFYAGDHELAMPSAGVDIILEEATS